jgi:hypothetical protein
VSTGNAGEQSGIVTMPSDEPVVTLTRGELKAYVSELMEEIIRDARPASATVKEVSGKATVEAKEYAPTVEEAMTAAVAAWRSGMAAVGRTIG